MTEKTAIYRHYDKDGVLLYVGLSLNPIKRLGQHRIHSLWFYSIARMEIEWAKTREAAAEKEYRAVRRERPLFNTVYNRPNSKLLGETVKTAEKAAPSVVEDTEPEPTPRPRVRPIEGPPTRERAEFKVGLAMPGDGEGAAALVASGVPKQNVYDAIRPKVIDTLLKMLPQGGAIVTAPGVALSDEQAEEARDRGIPVVALA